MNFSKNKKTKSNLANKEKTLIMVEKEKEGFLAHSQ